MSEPPKELFLVCRDDDGEPIDPQAGEGWLWSEDDIWGTGEKYVRADEIERLREMLYAECDRLVKCSERNEKLEDRIWELEEELLFEMNANEEKGRRIEELERELIQSQ